MRMPLMIVIIGLTLNIIADIYIYQVLKKRFPRHRWMSVTQAVSAAVFNAFFVYLVFSGIRSRGDSHLLFVMWALYAIISIYISKYLFIIFDLLAKIPRLFKRRRLKWLSATGAWIGVTVFILFWWGALINRYAINVTNVEVESDRLPESFSGLTIAQISDIHLGSFGKDTTFVSCIVDRVNELQPDIIVFTGDMVNRHSAEALPFVSTLARLDAPLGVYAIRGNHDYGDYMDWASQAAKDSDNVEFTRIQRRMGITPLDNATVWLRTGSDSIALIGVENIGDPPFKSYGDLEKAFPKGVSTPEYKILLSHNPSHWEQEIKDREGQNVDLTLSGHTHAMQMEAFGLSPAAFRYPYWGGMYSDKFGHKLYVNIGCGEVGFPARIGATPEITIFKLKSAEK